MSVYQKSVTEIPYRALIPLNVTNLLVASGRSFPNDSTNPYRETPTCVAMGQAAGIAAAISARSSVPPDRLHCAEIQTQLLKQGAYLGPPQRLAELELT